MSLKSLGLSKDPKDAQRQLSCFPAGRQPEYSINKLEVRAIASHGMYESKSHFQVSIENMYEGQ